MIDFVKIHLGVDFALTRFDDVKSFFIDERLENTTLEFKSFNNSSNSEDNFKGLIRSVAAFLNSQGGLIIWGAPQEKKSNKSRSCQGTLAPVNQRYEKDFLVSKIASNIIPNPNGIAVSPLEDGDHYVYLIQVQSSIYSPHQFDNRYWMRTDSQTIVAPHHYVEALFKKIRYPDLKGDLSFGKFRYSKPDKGRADGNYIKLMMLVTLSNETPFQNEENVTFDLFSDIGSPIYPGDQWPPPSKEVARAVILKRPTYELDVLHFGNPAEYNRAVGYDGYSLFRTKSKSKIVLRFGGRYSPLRYSIYELDFSFFDTMRHIENMDYDFNGEIACIAKDVLVADSPIISTELYKWNRIQRD